MTTAASITSEIAARIAAKIAANAAAYHGVCPDAKGLGVGHSSYIATQLEIEMVKFQVSANGMVFGIYEAATEQEARDLCAQDAGYDSEAGMEASLEQPSELVAETV